MNEFKKIFKKVNGFKILRDYASSHVLFFSMICTFVLGLNKKSLELVRMAVSNKVVCRLRKKYKKFISDYKRTEDVVAKEKIRSNKVWICWLQGIDNAPPIVQKCYSSVVDNLVDREVILITEDNYRDWIDFPEHINRKIEAGYITRTHLSDLIRLELLENYGGTWIDATVYCTGGNIPKYLMDSDLFIYQIMKPGLDGHAARISSWFITSCTNHPIIRLTKALLYKYWEDNSRLVDYFLIHDMIELAIEAYPDEWAKVVPISSSIPHILLLRFADIYDSNFWKEIVEITPFHKLSYKFSDEQMQEFLKEGTYYSEVIMNK